MSGDVEICQCLRCHRHFAITYGSRACPECQSHTIATTGEIADVLDWLNALLNSPDRDEFLAPLLGPERCQVCHEPADVSHSQDGVAYDFCSLCYRNFTAMRRVRGLQ
jgi:hypothetical protein